MSGDAPVELQLVADPAGTMERLLRSLDAVDASGLTDWTLIGGLAVMARLETPHRPTADIDTLARDPAVPAREVLLTVASEATTTGVRLADGTAIDTIDVASTLDVDNLPVDNVEQRMFVLAHWWMANTAETAHLRLVSGGRAPVTTLVERDVLLARASALVAAKLQSIPTRRVATLDKRESDAYDVYRLLAADSAQTIPVELAGAPLDLGSWCADYLEELFVGSAVRVSRWIANIAGADAVADATDIEVVGSLAVDRLRHALEGGTT